MQNETLTLEEIRHRAPSAFAVAKHDSRSERYTYIPTVAAIEHLMKNGFMPVEAKQSNTRVADKREFTKHMIRFRHESQEVQVIPGKHERVSITFPEILLVNSHDGSSAWEEIMGLREQVCWNGLVVDKGTVASVKIRHSGEALDNVVEGAYRILGETKQLMTHIEPWKQLQLTDGEQKVFAEAAHMVRFGDADGKVETAIKPEQLLTVRRSQDNHNDLWTTFNRIQENAMKGGLTGRQPDVWENDQLRRGRRVRTRQVNGIDQDLKLNRALWALAENMAKLKAN